MYFDKYVSNTLAGSSNQKYFKAEKEEKGRIFYKVYKGGKFNYSFLFSNTIDSTFDDGSESFANIICSSWDIKNISVGIYESDFLEDVKEKLKDEEIKGDFKTLTFKGEKSKRVKPGEIFYTDEVTLDVKKDCYICLEITYVGKMIPCHYESMICSYKKVDDGWELSSQIPSVSMVGCDRKVKNKIAFVGDSVTQGIGVEFNSYKQWNSVFAELLGDRFSYWNLGIGYGRAEDFASLKSWFDKAKNNDIIFLCFGVNDIFKGFTEEKIKENLLKIINAFNENNIKVILQKIPPFDYDKEQRIVWENVNKYIEDELSKKVYKVFDLSFLSESKEKPYNAKYGGHPNSKGCKIWAEKLYKEVGKIL